MILNVRKFVKLPSFQKTCTLCNKEISVDEVLREEIVATYHYKSYKIAHKKCYDNYLNYIKDTCKNNKGRL